MGRVFLEWNDIEGLVVPWWKTIIPRLFGSKWTFRGFEYRIYKHKIYVIKEPKGGGMSELKPCPFCGCDKKPDSGMWSCGSYGSYESKPCLRNQLEQAKQIDHDLITDHGKEMGEKCRRIAELEIKVGNAEARLDRVEMERRVWWESSRDDEMFNNTLVHDILNTTEKGDSDGSLAST